MEELDPSLAELLQKNMAAQEAARAAQGPEKAPAIYGLTSDPLPEGAVAVVVRDPHLHVRGVLVLSEGMVNDRTMSLARLALLHDEMNVPRHSGRRNIFVWPDQRIEVNGRTSQMSFQITSTEARGTDAQALIAAAAKATVIDIEGIGTIRTVP